MKSTKRVVLLAMLGMLLLAGVAATGAVARSADQSAGKTVQIGRQNVAIHDLTVTVSDLHINGTDLPSKSIDDASYTVDRSTIRTNGFSIEYQGTTYKFCPITVSVDDVGLRLHDLSIGSGS